MSQKTNLLNKSLLKTIDLCYEDDSFAVFSKPSGLLVIPSPKQKNKNLTQIINQILVGEGSVKLYPCHRIDKETSGLIIYAKGKRNQKVMMDLFKRKMIEKEYIAFVYGVLSDSEGVFTSPVEDFDRKRHSGVSVRRNAKTIYRVTEQYKDFGVVRVQPVTGRKNQIRIHFAQNRHPLVGERKYAFAKDYDLKFNRTALHASVLRFAHPITGRKINIKSDLPKDMQNFLKENRKRRSSCKN